MSRYMINQTIIFQYLKASIIQNVNAIIHLRNLLHSFTILMNHPVSFYSELAFQDMMAEIGIEKHTIQILNDHNLKISLAFIMSHYYYSIVLYSIFASFLALKCSSLPALLIIIISFQLIPFVFASFFIFTLTFFLTFNFVFLGPLVLFTFIVYFFLPFEQLFAFRQIF